MTPPTTAPPTLRRSATPFACTARSPSTRRSARRTRRSSPSSTCPSSRLLRRPSWLHVGTDMRARPHGAPVVFKASAEEDFGRLVEVGVKQLRLGQGFVEFDELVRGPAQRAQLSRVNRCHPIG